jgi:hypothetical protein
MKPTPALNPDLVELVKALARANAARDIEAARRSRERVGATRVAA